MANKITEREIYNAMINGTIDADVMVEFATKKLAQLDKRNESAKIRAAKKRAEGNELEALVFGYVTEEGQTRNQITESMIADGHEVTVGKVQARLTALVEAGKVSKEKGKVAGEDGKSKAATFYALA
jgi:hypothetical protein